MNGRLLGVWEDGSPEWHEARRTRICASEIGTILGWNVFESRADLLDRKLGLTEPRPQTPAMARGHYLEAGIADWYADEVGVTYLDGSDGTYVHPEHGWMLANPDRLCSDGTLLEVKTAKEKTVERGWGRAGTDQIPLPYQTQCQWAMHVLGLTVCNVAVLFGSPFEFKKYRIRYDAGTVAYLIHHAQIFRADMTRHQTDRTAA